MWRPNMVQIIYIPIFLLGGIMFLSNWLRDLIILEWDITPFVASILGLIIVGFIVIFSGMIIYCIVKLNWILTQIITITKDDPKVREFLKELNDLKKRDKLI